MLNMTIKPGGKCKELLVSEMFEIIKEVGVQPPVTHTKVMKQLNIQVSVLTNFRANKKSLPYFSVSVQPDQNDIKEL
jgi:hypothetical protein